MSDFGIDLLTYAPHPDDAEICCGGLLIKTNKLGYRTGIIDLTEGELASQGSLEQRRDETGQASELLGLSLRENLRFPDGAICAKEELASGETQLLSVTESLRKHRPEVVLVPYWQARHPDHIAASELLTKAVFYAGLRKYPCQGKPFTPAQVVYYQMRYQFRPSFIVDISAEEEEKLRAIRCYDSQIKRNFIPGEDCPGTLISSPLSTDSMEARDRYYGAMIGCAYAEPYLVRNALSVSDPVEHFRKNPTRGSLIFPEVI